MSTPGKAFKLSPVFIPQCFAKLAQRTIVPYAHEGAKTRSTSVGVSRFIFPLFSTTGTKVLLEAPPGMLIWVHLSEAESLLGRLAEVAKVIGQELRRGAKGRFRVEPMASTKANSVNTVRRTPETKS